MLNYISSELYRARKSKIMKVLFIVGILLPTILGFFMVILGIEEPIELETSYLVLAGLGAIFTASFVGFTSLIFVYKKNEIYRILLTQGLSKAQLIICDTIVLQLLTLFIGTFIALLCLLINAILSYYLKYPIDLGLNSFKTIFIWLLYSQAVSNFTMIALTYITDSVGVATVFSIITGILITVGIQSAEAFESYIAIRAINVLFPSHLVSYKLSVTDRLFTDEIFSYSRLFLFDFIKTLAISFFVSHFAFKRREL